MKVLVVNAGSSSLKYQLIDMTDERLLAKGLAERIGEPNESVLAHKVGDKATTVKKPLNDHAEALELVLSTLVDSEVGVIKSLEEISAVGHRIVHGGDKYNKAVIIDEQVKNDIKDNIPLAPLHMPANLYGIEACNKVMPNVKNVAVFDTAFHQTMPDYAYLYAVPYNWYTDYKVRKYGFHGTSHEFIANELANILGKKVEDLKIISCHLGNGASICAIKNGKCVDTSMGFTPLEGLVMGTRSGDIDPSVVEYIMDKKGVDIHGVMADLNKKSGLLGISQVSGDMRDVAKNANLGNENCKKAINKFVHVVKKYIGAYASIMNGVDAIAFSAGTGENRDDIREKVMTDMEYLGINFDFEANRNFVRGENYKISKDSSKVAVYIIPTNEELSIARQTKNLVK